MVVNVVNPIFVEPIPKVSMASTNHLQMAVIIKVPAPWRQKERPATSNAMENQQAS